MKVIKQRSIIYDLFQPPSAVNIIKSIFELKIKVYKNGGSRVISKKLITREFFHKGDVVT
jgi:hypothetical protein